MKVQPVLRKLYVKKACQVPHKKILMNILKISPSQYKKFARL